MSTSELLVDHNAQCGYIRGMLCQDCNFSLIPAVERIEQEDRDRFIYRVEEYLKN